MRSLHERMGISDERWALLTPRERWLLYAALVAFAAVGVGVAIFLDSVQHPSRILRRVEFTGVFAIVFFLYSMLGYVVVRSARRRAELPATHGGQRGGERPGG